MKEIVIINGEAGCGKDTFVELVTKVCGLGNVKNISTIDPIKRMAMIAGWNGVKDDKSRKFLSDLKDQCEALFDTSWKYIKDAVQDFEDGSEEILFIHCREPKQIERLCKEYGAKSLLIVREGYSTTPSNHADANVYDYSYDFTVKNPGDGLRQYMLNALDFLDELEESYD